MIKQHFARIRGITTKYFNHYLRLYIYLYRFIEMNNNEKFSLFNKPETKFDFS